MTQELTKLRLVPAVVTSSFLNGNVTRRPESHFLDLMVDGQSLRLMTATPGPELVTELNRPWLSSVPEALERLLGRRPSEELGPGRVPLLLCHMDGDLACGALTATLRVDDAEVSWSDFLWEDGFYEPRPVNQLAQPLTFDRSQYEAAFADAYTQVAGSSGAGRSPGSTSDAGRCRPRRRRSPKLCLGQGVRPPNRCTAPARREAPGWRLPS